MHPPSPPRFQALYCRSRLSPANPGPKDRKLRKTCVHGPVLFIEGEQHTAGRAKPRQATAIRVYLPGINHLTVDDGLLDYGLVQTIRVGFKGVAIDHYQVGQRSRLNSSGELVLAHLFG